MTQPEALRLADFLEDVLHDWTCAHDAAAELRRLYAVNQELLETLKDAHEHIFVASPVDDKESDRVLQVIKTAIAKAEGEK